MKPIPEPVYPCKHCSDEYSQPASDLYWSSEDEAWVCVDCWDNGDTEEAKGVCLADAIAQAQAEHDAEVIDQFKDELVRSVNVMLKPHIEGVCEVVKIQLRQKAQEAK